MPIVTLTSDWQNDDFYVSALKGQLYSDCASVTVVDITHRIESFKYTQAAFVLKNAFNHFPEGTIHVVCINSEPTSDFPPVALKIKGHYFVGAANGIYSLMFDQSPEHIVLLEPKGNMVVSAFPELTLYARAAAFLANGGNIAELGPPLPGRQRFVQIMPPYGDNEINGAVIHIDSYFNVITNVQKSLFEQVGKNRKFKIAIKSEKYSVSALSQKYSDVDLGEMLALFNSLDLLELAMRNVRMAELIDIKINSPVTILFK